MVKIFTRSQAKEAKEQSLEKLSFERLLNQDCKLQIFKYFNLIDLIKFRHVCRSWNDLICGILLQKDSLKVFHSRGDIVKYIGPEFYEQRKVVPFLRFEECSKNFDIIYLKWRNLEEKSSFTMFLSTRMPNITKLMLAVEDDYTMDTDYKHLAKVLDAIPCLETFFFAINYEYIYNHEDNGWATTAKTLKVIENSLEKRSKHLKELFFYMKTRPMTRSKLKYNPGRLLDGLTTLHLFDDHPLRLIKPNTTIKELWIKCPIYFEFSSLKAVPNLEILRVSTNKLGDLSHVPNLKLLQTNQSLPLNASDIRKLNTLTKLEQLNCWAIKIGPEERLSDPARKQINRTVTHLQLNGELEGSKLPELMSNLPIILGWFGALERLTIYHKLDQKQRESIRARVPTSVAVNFVEYNIESFMGFFVPSKQVPVWMEGTRGRKQIANKAARKSAPATCMCGCSPL